MSKQGVSPSDRPQARLFNGPLDVIGDVHGEIEALRALLGHLGYAADGSHPGGRRAVFVGDLCDRGPDSPAVLDLVMGWVQAGHAQCVLGNHELNVLLGEPKHGNGCSSTGTTSWRTASSCTRRRRPAAARRLGRVPGATALALVRDDLRVVHACWDEAALARLVPQLGQGASYRDIHAELDKVARELLRASGINARAAREVLAYRTRSGSQRHAAHVAGVRRGGTLLQNANPVKVVTSGLEGPSERPIWAGGRWRMTHRARWWNEYRTGRWSSWGTTGAGTIGPSPPR